MARASRRIESLQLIETAAVAPSYVKSELSKNYHPVTFELSTPLATAGDSRPEDHIMS